MSKRPNVIFFLTDDQGPWAMGCAGNSEIKTPNLDKLAATGMRFENFFCASPVCSPARASLITGRIPSQHGVHDWIAAGDTIAKYEPARNGELIEYLQGQLGYTDVLADSGYHCGISGKWHLGDSHHAQKGFEFWSVHSKGGGPYYNAPMVHGDEVYEEPDYVTDAITNTALQWLEDQKNSDSPFYLSVHYTAPHSPWGRDHHPAEIYDSYFNDCSFDSLPKELPPADWIRYIGIKVENEERRREVLTGYFTAVTAMDENVGRIISWLETNGLREDTLVIFTSDNGMNMGHHGVYGKGNATYPMNMYEEAVKVPFLISQPGTVPEDQVNQDLVSQYDFMPTLLDYLGLDNPVADQLPGRSFAGVLRGQESTQHDHVVVYDEYGPVRMVRTKEWKYVHRYEIGANELYDLVNDPAETTNLIGKPEYAVQEAELREQLNDWFARYVDPDRDGAKEFVTGSGQFGLCGKYADGVLESFDKSRIEHLLDTNGRLIT